MKTTLTFILGMFLFSAAHADVMDEKFKCAIYNSKNKRLETINPKVGQKFGPFSKKHNKIGFTVQAKDKGDFVEVNVFLLANNRKHKDAKVKFTETKRSHQRTLTNTKGTSAVLSIYRPKTEDAEMLDYQTGSTTVAVRVNGKNFKIRCYFPKTKEKVPALITSTEGDKKTKKKKKRKKKKRKSKKKSETVN